MKLPHAVALVAILITRPAFALTGKRYLPEGKITRLLLFPAQGDSNDWK
jgi:hypothetical protein